MAKLLLLYSHYVFFKVMISFLAGRNFVKLQARSCPCIMRGIFFGFHHRFMRGPHKPLSSLIHFPSLTVTASGTHASNFKT